MKTTAKIAILAFLVLAVGFPLAWAKEVSQPKKATTPSIRTAEGSVSDVNLNSEPPFLKLTESNGEVVKIELNSKTTKVFSGNQTVDLSRLKMGEKVKVREIQKNGKPLAKSVDILA